MVCQIFTLSGLRALPRSRASHSGLPAELLPVYALDQQGVGGKIALSRASILSRTPDRYVLAGRDGRTFRYPVEN
jgi:hypothetical protein